MPGGCYYASAWSWVLGLCWRGLIAIKDSSPIYGCDVRRGKVWEDEGSCYRWWFGEVFLGRSSAASSGEGRVVSISKEEYWCVCMECLWNSWADPGFICHHLNVNPTVLPTKQPPRCLSKEHSDAIKEEVNKLKQAGAIKEVFYPEWSTNTMVVKKKNVKWRVCVDFTDLNKACPKDLFPMSWIDRLVDATMGHPRMSFLDAF